MLLLVDFKYCCLLSIKHNYHAAQVAHTMVAFLCTCIYNDISTLPCVCVYPTCCFAKLNRRPIIRYVTCFYLLFISTVFECIVF